MKHILKTVAFLLLAIVPGCDDYVRTGVKQYIYVNKEMLNMFVGEQAQLKASPAEITCNWQSEDTEIATVTATGLVEAVGAGSTNIVASYGDIRTKVPVTAVVKIPLEDVTLNTEFVEVFIGGSLLLTTTPVPLNANNVERFSWHSENETVATITSSGEVKAIQEGVTNIIYRCGDITKTITVNVVDRVQAFKGPHILSAAAPCIIPIRDFDTGGEGYAFHDSDATNSAGNAYRRDNGDPNSPGVDVQADGAIGYTNAGEWLIYTVQVQDAGDYLIDVNLSANGAGAMHIEVDGENVSGTITLPSNGGWSNWTWRPDPAITVTLSTGKHKVKYYIETANHNLNQIRFTHQE